MKQQKLWYDALEIYRACLSRGKELSNSWHETRESRSGIYLFGGYAKNPNSDFSGFKWFTA